jgi:hypothetical protein
MRTVNSIASAIALVLMVAGTPSAQNRPNVAGTWTVVADAAAAVGTVARPGSRGGLSATDANRGSGGGGIGGAAFRCHPTCTMIQTATTLTITRPVNPDGTTPPVVVLNLDGSESPNQQAGRQGGPPTPYVAIAKWDGNKLVVTRSLGSQQHLLTVQTLSLESGNLTIVTTNPGIDIAVPQTLTFVKSQ